MLKNIIKWTRDKEGIYLITYPEDITIDYIIEISTEIIQDYVNNKNIIPNFNILVDGSNVKSYDLKAMDIIVEKVQKFMDGKIAVYKMSDFYRNVIKDYASQHKILPNIKYFECEPDARIWIKSESDDNDFRLLPKEVEK